MDNDKRIQELELEIRKLQMIIRLQKDIIESYQELAAIAGSKVVIQ